MKQIEKIEFKCGGISECHLMLHVDDKSVGFPGQLNELNEALRRFIEGASVCYVPIIIRLFVSDSYNQADDIRHFVAFWGGSPVSVVEQPPLDGSKVAMWVWLQSNVKVARLDNGLFKVTDGIDGLTHYLGVSMKDKTESATSKLQMKNIFTDYVRQLDNEKLTLKNDCIRTWIFVQNVDVNYGGVVSARNEVFKREGLTDDTHFIASTGIQGRSADFKHLVEMDAYCVEGLLASQVQFLYAKDFLNPTYEYGVSFERGTCVHYSDRRHVFISGTASIDNKGSVLYVGDVERQVERACENVNALLSEADSSFDDVAQMIVYLRDVEDYCKVKAIYDHKFPNIPKVIVHAPVCRPSWLVEMECIAVKLS